MLLKNQKLDRTVSWNIVVYVGQLYYTYSYIFVMQWVSLDTSLGNDLTIDWRSKSNYQMFLVFYIDYQYT